jgi:hypothetical protein
MRCTERSEMPATAAMARPVQWVVSLGGLPQVSATTRDTVSAGIGGLPGWRVLSRSSPSTPLGKTLLPPPDHRTADSELNGDLLHRPTVRRCEDHLRPLHVLTLAVPVRDDRHQPLAVRGTEDDS